MIPPMEIGQKRDFRDPQAYYDEETNKIYMTVTAAVDGVARILKYSMDPELTHPQYEGILLTDPTKAFWNLECSDCFQIGDKWYLTYSGQDDTLWYAMSDSRFGDYTEPVRLEGKLFYAAKQVSDGKNNYMVGWTRRSESPSSMSEVSAWGGNLSIQQLVQNPDGTLALAPIDAVREAFNQRRELLLPGTAAVVEAGSRYTYLDAFIGTDYSREAVKALGTGQVFVNHIQRVIKAARKAGAKTIQLWGDIVQKYAELIPQLPDDVIVMVWNYNPLPKFDALPVFRDTGREFWAAGGVGTWNGIFPRTYNAYINLSNLSVQAHEMGANGFLVTDWGDYGHMQPLGLGLYGYVIGALQADSAMARSGDELEKAIWPLILGDEQLERGFRALMDSNLAENLKTDFKTMSIYYFFDDMLDGLSMRGNENYARLTEKTFRELLRCGSEAVCALTGKISPRRFPDQNWEALFGADYLAELRLSARMTQFIGQKGILACRIREALQDPSLTPDGVMALILEVHALYDEFCLIRREFKIAGCSVQSTKGSRRAYRCLTTQVFRWRRLSATLPPSGRPCFTGTPSMQT